MKQENFNFYIFSIVLILLFCMTGAAFTAWSVDESKLTPLQVKQQKALYIAEYGAREKAVSFLQSADKSKIRNEYFLNGGEVSDINDASNLLGNYSDIRIVRPAEYKNTHLSNLYYDIYCTGYLNEENNQTDGLDNIENDYAAFSSLQMRVKLRTFADYMYLSNFEISSFNEILWFWQLDAFNGPVHSNSAIGITGNPTFYGPVSISASEFYENNANPYFAFPPVFNAPEIVFPTSADSLRYGAQQEGSFISDDDGNFWTRLFFNEGNWECWQWPAGTVYDSLNTVSCLIDIFPSSTNSIFVEGNLYIWGEDITGITTIGSSGRMWLCDDICIDGYSLNSREDIDTDNPNILGLVSEKSVVIKDSYPNGRGNCDGGEGFSDYSNITITAMIVALGGSLTIEHQNDPWDNYIWCIGHPGPDERGDLIIRGAIIQYRHGYVHRSNCGGTGYGSDYSYDQRLAETPPPYTALVVDNNGNYTVDIINIEEIKPVEITE